MTAITGTPDLATFGYGTLARLITDSAATRARMDRLTAQESSGLVSDSYAGLGTGISVSLALQPALAQQTTWKANIDAATGPMQAAQTALSQINAIATDFYARTNNLNGLNASTIDSVAASARDAMKQVAGLLNTRFGDLYVFAGKDSRTAPVPDPAGIATSGFANAITASVQALDVDGTDATTQATLSTGASNDPALSPFSVYLSNPAGTLANERAMVEVADNRMVPTGILASANSDTISLGTSTTGSYMRDILRALATLGALGSAQADSPNLAGLVADTRASLGGAISAMGQDAGVLGDRQKALADTGSRLDEQSVALQAQLAGAQQVDMASTLSQLTQTQTQLQASYQLIAAMQGMSLVKYL
jgi:flagellar hook-associated protein 3 FlgL